MGNATIIGEAAHGNRPARRRHRAYALILTVAILAIIAIIGVAFLNTTHIDRYATRQHATNTQADLLVDGVMKLVEAALIDDLFDGATSTESYRRLGEGAGGSYRHSDGATADLVGGTQDHFLAERVPEHSGGAYRWRAISGPIVGDTFTFPGDGRTIPRRWNVTPTSLTINGRVLPALDFGNGDVMRAADTDGDGIADAGMWEVPANTEGGLRWYAAVRVIDDSAALNLSIASRAAPEGSLFPTHADLESVLLGSDLERAAQVDALNRYRAGGADVGLAVFSDAGTERSDLRFASVAEARLRAPPPLPGWRRLRRFRRRHHSIPRRSRNCGARSATSCAKARARPPSATPARTLSTPTT